MADSKDKKCEYCGCSMSDCRRWKHYRHSHNSGSGCGAIYFFGFIGALVYFLSQATNFWAGVVGFFQAIVWPAYMVYEGLKLLIK